ncbi:MAG: hypothetical protein IKU30_06020 [Clostridia bacterium]|nr:hypothetical protein [Clostridia bacterium]MBR6447838.1 hypothetical protein [Methanomicrobium sp.]
MDIYRSQYTAAQIEASIGKSPRINTTTGEWEIWDISSGKYVGTGVVNVTKDYVDDHYVTAGQLDGSDLGERATAEGAGVTASGEYSHAEGIETVASGSGAHAEGMGCYADNDFAHAEGQDTSADGFTSHSEGCQTTASGSSAHAEGYHTVASGDYSHAGGIDTIANHRSQNVFGEFNVEDSSVAESTDKGNYIEIVGNGDYNNRSNARTLDWGGNEVISGKLTVGAAPANDMDVTTKKYVDDAIAAIRTALGI